MNILAVLEQPGQEEASGIADLVPPLHSGHTQVM
jgi:hypothetical protein